MIVSRAIRTIKMNTARQISPTTVSLWLFSDFEGYSAVRSLSPNGSSIHQSTASLEFIACYWCKYRYGPYAHK